MKRRTGVKRQTRRRSKVRTALRRRLDGLGADGEGIRKILVPVDFSDCSAGAVACAVRFARSFNAALVLLHVAETKPAGAELGPSHLPDLEKDLRKMARQRLTKLRRWHVPPSVPSQAVIRAGRSDVQILKAADALDADLIVMAAHSDETQQGQLGTTAGRVAGAARCPVMLVPVAQACPPFFI
jgi:nucleotide-binding universal stress UspA family protein